jgi:hypothetical protein
LIPKPADVRELKRRERRAPDPDWERLRAEHARGQQSGLRFRFGFMICDMLDSTDCRMPKAGCKPALRTGRGLQAASMSKPWIALVDFHACRRAQAEAP